MSSITSLERVLLTIDHKIPDRVPTDLHNFMMAARLAGYRFPEFFQNGEMMADAQIKAWKRFGHDVLLLENGVCATAQALGCGVFYPEDGPPRVIEPVLRSLEDIDKLQVPDPYKAHPLPELLKATRIVSREIGDKVFVMGRADQGPFALAAAIRGYDKFIMDIATRERLDLVHRVLEFCKKTVTRYALAQMEQGAHGTSIGEFGPDIIGPKAYREFAFPYDREFISELKGHGIPVALHICGDAGPVVRDMVDTGAAILELDYKTDMNLAKDATRGRATVLGPINPAETLWRGTPEIVERESREAIQVYGPGGGFILGPGCALGPDTPPENINSLIAAARKYGRYRPDGSLDV